MSEAPSPATTAAPRVIAEVRDYDGLIAGLRAWVHELNTPCEVIDDLAGLPTRYTSKLLGPVPVRGLGRQSLGPLLGALGLKLHLVVDVETLAKMSSRLVKRQYASAGMLPMKSKKRRAHWKGDLEWSRILNARRSLMVSPNTRKRIAKRAAKVRWSKPKVVEIKGEVALAVIAEKMRRRK